MSRVIIIILIVAVVLLVAVLIWGAINTGTDARRIADLKNTVDSLSAKNKQLESTIGRFEAERSEIYRGFEKAISGASGDISAALETIERLGKISEKIAN